MAKKKAQKKPPARKVRTVVNSSFQAWLKKMKEQYTFLEIDAINAKLLEMTIATAKAEDEAELARLKALGFADSLANEILAYEKQMVQLAGADEETKAEFSRVFVENERTRRLAEMEAAEKEMLEAAKHEKPSSWLDREPAELNPVTHEPIYLEDLRTKRASAVRAMNAEGVRILDESKRDERLKAILREGSGF